MLSTVGFVLLLVAIHGLRRDSPRRTRPARIGATMSLLGASMLVVFGALVLATGIAVSIVLIASHSGPFSGQISVRPDLLMQVMPSQSP